MSEQLIGVTRPLYVVKFQPTLYEPKRPLTAEERVMGWREGILWNDDEVVRDGHSSYSLHTLSGPHVLTWTIQPGDEVVVVFQVEMQRPLLTNKIDELNHLEIYLGRPTSLYCERIFWGRHGHGRYGVHLTTVLGRAVMLGEDGAEDAFGHDALTQHLECYLEGDHRPMLCQAHFEFWPENE